MQVVVSRAYERRTWEREREKNRRARIERKRRSETALAREQGCTRALFACVYDVNIIRQTHLNRLKILTSTSRPPPLCELFACDFIEVRLATSPAQKYSLKLYDRSRPLSRICIHVSSDQRIVIWRYIYRMCVHESICFVHFINGNNDKSTKCLSNVKRLILWMTYPLLMIICWELSTFFFSSFIKIEHYHNYSLNS